MEQIQEQYRFTSREAYLKHLDMVLPPSCIQKRKIGNSTKDYYPIAIQESKAHEIFHYWNIIDEKYQTIANELICTVKLEYMPSYPGADVHTCTGTGSNAIEMSSGSKCSDFPNNKSLNALDKNLGSARSKAIGCALGSLGNIFGQNLSRKINESAYMPSDFTFRKFNNVENE